MCRFCVGTLFTNKDLYSGWPGSVSARELREQPSRRNFMALAGQLRVRRGLACSPAPRARSRHRLERT